MRCVACCVACGAFGVWRVARVAWCVLRSVRCVSCGAWRAVRGAQNGRRAAWRVVRGAWRVACGARVVHPLDPPSRLSPVFFQNAHAGNTPRRVGVAVGVFVTVVVVAFVVIVLVVAFVVALYASPQPHTSKAFQILDASRIPTSPADGPATRGGAGRYSVRFPERAFSQS